MIVMQIVKSKDGYSIYSGSDFFGLFHSIAEAEFKFKAPSLRGYGAQRRFIKYLS